MTESLLDYFNQDQLAASVWLGKYAIEGEETPDEMHRRLAKEFAKNQQIVTNKNISHFGKTRTYLSEEKIYEYFKNFQWIIPQGSVMSILGSNKIGSLSNCFRGDVKVLTRDGWKPISDLADKEVEIMTKGGQWCCAPFKNYGEQLLYEVNLTNGYKNKTLYATKDHRWAIFKKTKKDSISDIKITSELNINDILYSTYSKFRNYKPSAVGIAHGIVYGDGHSVRGENNCNNLTLCSDSRILGKYFPESFVSSDETLCEGGADFYSYLPNFFRNLPSIRENKSYLYGWLAGYFSADGHIDDRGSVMINSAKKDDLQFVLDVCGVLGIGCTDVSEQTVISNLTNKEHTMYKCVIHKNHLTEDFFLLEKHKYRYNNTEKEPARWKVLSITETEIIEPVYCAEVPVTESFVIEGNILSMNCFVIGQPYDSYGGIMQKDQEMAQLMKRRGGVGIDISTLRPNGTKVTNAAGTSTGAVSFMERYSNTTREVAQNGRRGALMISIDVRHPDVLDFVTIKQDPTKVTGANVSVQLRDDFMQAVEEDAPYVLRWPCEREVTPQLTDLLPYDEVIIHELGVVKKIRAKELWKSIVTCAHASAEPGLMFLDKHWNLSPDSVYPAFKGQTTNPCFPSSEYLLTKDGYVSFGQLYKEKQELNIVQVDNRISFLESNPNIEYPEDWKIDLTKNGTSFKNASGVFLTKIDAEIITLYFANGAKISCTPDHHIATTIGMIEAKDLNVEHEVLIGLPDINGSVVNQMPYTDLEKIALLVGLLSGGGTFIKQSKTDIACFDFWGEDQTRIVNLVTTILDSLFESYGGLTSFSGKTLAKYNIIRQKNKTRITSAYFVALLEKHFFIFNHKNKHSVPELILNYACTNVGKFYLAGLMYCDGSIMGNLKRGISVRLSQSNLDFLRQVQMLLNANGFFSSIKLRRHAQLKKLPDGKGGLKEYWTKSQYEIILSSSQTKNYLDAIGFLGDVKKEKKYNVFTTPENLNNTTSLVEIQKSLNEDVYCIKEPETRSIIVNTLSTRRCGEIFMQKYDACRLLAANLYSLVKNPFTSQATLDLDKAFEIFYEQQILADNLVTLELEHIDRIIAKIELDEEPFEVKRAELELWKNIKQTASNSRRTGSGFTALGDMLAALNLAYDSDGALEVIEQVMRTKFEAEFEASIDMAIVDGPFKGWNPTLEFDLDEDGNPVYGNNAFYQHMLEEFPDMAKRMCKFGRRNVNISTVAPTGTVSLMTQTTSGLEPIFMVSYTRRRKVNPGENARVDFVDQNGDSWMEYSVLHPKFIDWYFQHCESSLIRFDNLSQAKEYLENLTVAEVNKLVEISPWYKSTANDIDWIKRVKIQSVIQKYTSHSISSTINLPNNVSVEEVSKIYLYAWKHNLKGITVYRDGCRSGVMISNESKNSPSTFDYKDAVKRPKELSCTIDNISVNKQPFTVIVGLLDEKPYEVFVLPVSIMKDYKNGILTKKGKGSYTLTCSLDEEVAIVKDITISMTDEQQAITRLVSTSLRHGANVKYICEQLLKTEGALNSFTKAIARILKKHIPDGEKSTVLCESCGGSHVIFEDGCQRCVDCGASKCG